MIKIFNIVILTKEEFDNKEMIYDELFRQNERIAHRHQELFNKCYTLNDNIISYKSIIRKQRYTIMNLKSQLTKVRKKLDNNGN